MTFDLSDPVARRLWLAVRLALTVLATLCAWNWLGIGQVYPLALGWLTYHALSSISRLTTSRPAAACRR